MEVTEPPKENGPQAEVPKRSPEEIAKQVLDSREVRVFRPSQVRFDPRRVHLPDEFFAPSTAELSTAVKQYAAASQRLQDAPLMTKKMRDAEKAKKMSRFRKTLIRVLLPDRIALQGIFTPQTTIRQVVRFVRAALLDARNVKFHLFVVPPKMKLLDLDKTLYGEGLCPAALVHLGIDEGPEVSSQLLKPWLLDRIEDTPDPTPEPEPKPEPMTSANPPQSAEAKPVPPEQKKKLLKKLPKWFKK